MYIAIKDNKEIAKFYGEDENIVRKIDQNSSIKLEDIAKNKDIPFYIESQDPKLLDMAKARHLPKTEEEFKDRYAKDIVSRLTDTGIFIYKDDLLSLKEGYELKHYKTVASAKDI